MLSFRETGCLILELGMWRMKIILDLETIVSQMNISREAFENWKLACVAQRPEACGSLGNSVNSIAALGEYQASPWIVQPE